MKSNKYIDITFIVTPMILIFDVDGTITDSGKQIDAKMLVALQSKKVQGAALILVGGGTYEKILWQICGHYELFDSIFACCGTEMYKSNKLVHKKDMLGHCDKGLLNKIIKVCLLDIAELDIDYSGHQIEFRSGLVYVSPVGLQANDKERAAFIELDKKCGVRRKLIDKIRTIDTSGQFEVVIGGAAGIAIYPRGWNKAQIMEHINTEGTVYFFGDKTDIDGNDYPLYSHPKVKGFNVKDYHDTCSKLACL
jgi:phosphomannomutase